jgi:hypothetical protein
MNGASIGQDYLCRVAGTTRFGPSIDSEVGRVPAGRRLFTYARYNVDFGDLRGLGASIAEVGAAASEISAIDAIDRIGSRKLAKLDATGHIGDLYRLGHLAGRLVDAERHFSGFGPR